MIKKYIRHYRYKGAFQLLKPGKRFLQMTTVQYNVKYAILHKIKSNVSVPSMFSYIFNFGPMKLKRNPMHSCVCSPITKYKHILT